MNLKKRQELQDKQLKRTVNNLFLVYSKSIGGIIDQAYVQTIATITIAIAHTPKDQFNYIMLSKIKQGLRHSLSDIFDSAADQIVTQWSKNLKSLTLLARISTTYQAKISQPPWIPAKLNLSDGISKDEKFDPRKGHVHYAMNNMVDNIMKQLQRSALMKESPMQAVQRVQKMFSSKKKHGVRESKYQQNDQDLPVDESIGPVDMQSGAFSPDDIQALYTDMIEANGWEGRGYSPYFTDELQANNKALYQLEQFMAESALHVVSDAQLKAGTDLENVDDFKWFVSRPGVCDCCDRRAGLTMTQIRDKIDDQYGDMPPPLHPNCRCSLAPIMNNKFAEDSLEDQGVSWDPETGNLDVPKDVQTRYRTDLSLDDFIKQLKSGDYGKN